MTGQSQKFEFDFLSSSLDETILKDHQYIKSHFLGTDVARKVKLVDLAYKWEDPPTPTRSTPLIKIEKQPIYFALKKVISPKFYKKKIKEQAITKDQAIEQIIEILDIALMIRYQDTDQFESILRNLDKSIPNQSYHFDSIMKSSTSSDRCEGYIERWDNHNSYFYE